MKKEGLNTYKGIDYVLLSSLPTEQAESLKKTLNERTLIKILKEDIVLNDCVLYTAYLQWFNANSVETSTKINPPQKATIKEQFTVA